MADDFRLYIVVSSFLLLALLTVPFVKVDAAKLSFCDDTVFVEKTREQCGAGFTFGDNKPDCICVTGIYRFIADSCETADGFADNVCTKLTDDNGLGASIVAVKFTRDPMNWNQTGIVCERKGFGTETFDFITDKHLRGSTSRSSNIYAVNGRAYLVPGHRLKQAFCVEPVQAPDSEKICRYLKSENEKVWNDTELEVIVKPQCKEGGVPLVPHKCFGLLKEGDSECALTCDPKMTRAPLISRSVGWGEDSMLRKMTPKPTPQKTVRTPSPTPTTTSGPSVDEPSHVTEYWKHDNKFLNRKMMTYNIISQLSTDGTSKITYGEPKRTFELFEMMKDITKTYCPKEFVAPDWLDLVVDLFYVIHKGNIFKYEENLSEGDYLWIKEILTTCMGRVSTEGPLTITPDPTLPDPEEPMCHPNGGGLGTGFCNGTRVEDGSCNFVPVILPEDRANDSYHFVPEVAWDVVDIIQVICFPEFNESYRMFHVLEQAAEKLFTLQVKNLWYYPNWSVKTKKRLLGTNADTQMHNLEVCIYAAYFQNGLIPRLVRPRPVKYLRKKRSLAVLENRPPIKQTSEGSFVDVYCSRTRKEFHVSTPYNCNFNQ